MICVNSFFSAYKCILGAEGNTPFRFAYFHIALYSLLVIFFIAATVRLMRTLQSDFYMIYHKVRCRIVVICLVGATTLSVRIALSIVYSLFEP